MTGCRSVDFGLQDYASLSVFDDDVSSPEPLAGNFLKVYEIPVLEASAVANAEMPKQVAAESAIVREQESQGVGEGVFIATRQAKYALDGGSCPLVLLPDVQRHDCWKYATLGN